MSSSFPNMSNHSHFSTLYTFRINFLEIILVYNLNRIKCIKKNERNRQVNHLEMLHLFNSK